MSGKPDSATRAPTIQEIIKEIQANPKVLDKIRGPGEAEGRSSGACLSDINPILPSTQLIYIDGDARIKLHPATADECLQLNEMICSRPAEGEAKEVTDFRLKLFLGRWPIILENDEKNNPNSYPRKNTTHARSKAENQGHTSATKRPKFLPVTEFLEKQSHLLREGGWPGEAVNYPITSRQDPEATFTSSGTSRATASKEPQATAPQSGSYQDRLNASRSNEDSQGKGGQSSSGGR